MCQLLALLWLAGLVTPRSPLIATILEQIHDFDNPAMAIVESLYSGGRVGLPGPRSELLGWLHEKNRPYPEQKLLKEKHKVERFLGIPPLPEQKANC